VAITDSGDGMIKLHLAVSASDNTTGVAAEGNTIGINSNRDGAESNGSHELILLVSLDVVNSSHLNGTVVGSKAAVSVGGIRVCLFKVDASIVVGVPEAVVRPAALASERVQIAINALLFGEL
jgi:hypothetical protein